MTTLLRDYQTKCLKTISRSYERGTYSQLIVLPTGAGRAYILAQCVLDFDWPSHILVHRDELAIQAVAKLVAAGVSPSDIGIVMGDQDQLGKKITVGSVQTLSRSGGKRLEALLRVSRPRIVVIDEAHHAATKSYRMIIKRIRPDLLIGFTSTPDHLVGEIFDRITFQRSIMGMVMDGFLVPPKRKLVNTETSLTVVKVKSGDYDRTQLGRILDNRERHQKIVQAWHEYGEGRKTIVHVVDFINADKVALVFGVDARVIHNKLSKIARARILESFENREFDVLVSCEDKLGCTEVSCVLMARPTLSKALYIQMIGRSLQPYEGKTDTLIIDVMDRSLRPSINFQDIMPQAKDILALLRKMPKAQLDFLKEDSSICYDPHYRWIKYGNKGYSLSIGKGESVHVIRRELTGNMVVLSSHKDWIVEHPLFPEYAFAVAEQWASDRSHQLGMKKPYGWTELSWWDVGPTDSQIEYAKKFGIKPSETMAEMSYRIDEQSLRPKFGSAIGYIARQKN